MPLVDLSMVEQRYAAVREYILGRHPSLHENSGGDLLLGRSQTYLGRLLTVRGLGLRYPSWTDPSDTRASHGDHLRDRPGR